jgi:hypothetical protein
MVKNEIMQVDVSRRVIFESPDGGNTIYKRTFDSLTRELHQEDPEVIKQQELAIRSQRMMRIIRLAETNPTLRDALEKLETLYALVKDHEENN